MNSRKEDPNAKAGVHTYGCICEYLLKKSQDEGERPFQDDNAKLASHLYNLDELTKN